MKLKTFGMLAIVCSLLMPSVTLAAQGAVETFVDTDVVGWNQLVTCPDSSSVYWIAADGNRFTFLNEKTFLTWYPDFTYVVEVPCPDLSKFPLAGNVTQQPGTRYVKITSDPTVYAVEPGGVLRAIPNEEWMEVFVGEGWNTMIDDVPDGFWPSYTIGEPLAIREIPDGMTAIHPETGVYYYFVDGQPMSLEGISFAYRHNDHFKSFTRTMEQAPLYYDRIIGAMNEASRIDSENELWLGTFKTDRNNWIETSSEQWPTAPIVEMQNYYQMPAHENVSFYYPMGYYVHQNNDDRLYLSTQEYMGEGDFVVFYDSIYYEENTTIDEYIEYLLSGGSGTSYAVTPKEAVTYNGNDYVAQVLHLEFGGENHWYFFRQLGDDIIAYKAPTDSIMYQILGTLSYE